jgi:hypothetical protein
MIRKTWNMIEWSEEMKSFLKDNFFQKTNHELASELGLKLTTVRTKCYELGLKRMEMEYFTEEQIEFLKDNYKHIGDVEMAEIFEKKWKKNKRWTEKHIRKKRCYLNLHRTKKEVNNVKQRNIDTGRFAECAVKRWVTTTQAPAGEIRIWKYSNGRSLMVIKTENGFKHFNRWLWLQYHASIKKDHVIIIKDPTLPISIENLEEISWRENARKNAALRMKYPEEIRLSIKTLKLLNKKIKSLTNENQ